MRCNSDRLAIDEWREAIRVLHLEFGVGRFWVVPYLSVLMVDDSHTEKIVSLETYSLQKRPAELVMSVRCGKGVHRIVLMQKDEASMTKQLESLQCTKL